MYETFYDISLDSMASHLQARSRTNIPEGAFYEEVHNPSTKGILKINLLTTKKIGAQKIWKYLEDVKPKELGEELIKDIQEGLYGSLGAKACHHSIGGQPCQTPRNLSRDVYMPMDGMRCKQNSSWVTTDSTNLAHHKMWNGSNRMTEHSPQRGEIRSCASS